MPANWTLYVYAHKEATALPHPYRIFLLGEACLYTVSAMLHITDGESVAGTLRQSTVPGEVRIFGDLMYEGPTPAGLSDAEWWDRRAKFLSQSGFGLTPAEAGHGVRAFQDSLHAISNSDETVLWMDHRLSDQLILIMLLERFYRLHRRSIQSQPHLHRTFPRHGKVCRTWLPYGRAACLAR